MLVGVGVFMHGVCVVGMGLGVGGQWKRTGENSQTPFWGLILQSDDYVFCNLNFDITRLFQ